jgi:hypothetical protein
MIVPLRGEPPEAAGHLAAMAREGGAELVLADGAGPRGERLADASRRATGDVLFFVHADSRPPDRALSLVAATIAGGASAGAFSLAYDGGGAAMGWIAWWANSRARLLGLPFGDQGIFCRRDAYERAGGFRPLPVCDDVDLVRRLKRVGRFVIRREKTVTSPRRYLERGRVSQLLRSWAVLAGYYAGVAPETLERWYYGSQPETRNQRPETSRKY